MVLKKPCWNVSQTGMKSQGVTYFVKTTLLPVSIAASYKLTPVILLFSPI